MKNKMPSISKKEIEARNICFNIVEHILKMEVNEVYEIELSDIKVKLMRLKNEMS